MTRWEALFGYAVEPGRYLYHYTSAATLASILDSGSVRLGPYLKTNDPLETRLWLQRIRMPAQSAEHLPHGWAEKAWGSYGDIRNRTRLACFTLDDVMSDRLSLNLFHRGWCRPRMWAQYADGHRGACLVIDKQRWDEQVDARWPPGSGSVVHRDRVHYQDVAWGGFKDFLTFDWEDLQPDRLEETMEKLLNGKGAELFFRKNRDWESENEYRYVIQSSEEYESVALEESLVGIVVSQDFPDTERSVLRHRLAAAGFADVSVAQLAWADGAPRTVLQNISERPSLPPAELP